MGRLRCAFPSKLAVSEFHPKHEKRQLWTMDNKTTPSSSTASAQSSTLNTSTRSGSCIPYASNKNFKKQPIPSPLTSAVKEELGQARSMIVLVLEELVNTEGSYLHILSQFLLLRDEIFAPNWRIDRRKFM